MIFVLIEIGLLLSLIVICFYLSKQISSIEEKLKTFPLTLLPCKCGSKNLQKGYSLKTNSFVIRCNHCEFEVQSHRNNKEEGAIKYWNFCNLTVDGHSPKPSPIVDKQEGNIVFLKTDIDKGTN